MNAERWKQVESILQSALDHPPAERDALLRNACAGDEALERDVRSLLASDDQAGSFLNRPAVEVVAEAEAGDSPVGRTISHYRVIERSAAAEWVWSIRLRISGCIAMWLSSFCRRSSRAIVRC